MSWCGGGLISVTPGRRVPQLGDQPGHLEARQLPALAGLGALGDLDLDLAAGVQILGRDAEPAGGDLLDRASWRCRRSARGLARAGSSPPSPLSLRAPMRFIAMRQRLVRLGAQRAERDAGREQALADLGDALDLVDRDRRDALGAEVQQVAQRHRLLPAHRRRRSGGRSRSCRSRPRSAACGSGLPSKACTSPRWRSL